MLFLLQQCLGFQERRNFLKTVPLLAVPNEKFCKNCKFFKKDFFTETKYGHCSHFPNEPTNNYLVDTRMNHQPVIIIVLPRDLLTTCVDQKESTTRAEPNGSAPPF